MDRYDRELMAAWLRGSLGDVPELREAGEETLLEAARQAGLKPYVFKQQDQLPRVRAVLGFLHGVQPESLLDVGSGRGVFLFPFLREFPEVPVTSLDLLPKRVEMLQTISRGGYGRLTALRQDICAWDAPAGSFDVVTMLEVLEHIPDAAAAVRNAVRLAGRYVVVSVPSKPDTNPEHIHLFSKAALTDMFREAGCGDLRFGGVNGHLLLTAHLK